MERTRRRARNGQRHGQGEGKGLSPDLIVEGLRRRFARFRRAHQPRTRFPPELRVAALEALRCGATELAVRRACGVSSIQMAQWRRGEESPVEARDLAGPEARVFAVVDAPPDLNVARTGAPAERDVELRLGGWAIWIRRLEA
jgi:hypothetical protein